MKKIRYVLRLTFELGMSRRQVAAATGIGRTAVTDYVQRAGASGLDWPHIHAEMKRRGVTMSLLWQEYRIEHGKGYPYSWFCERYRAWKQGVSPVPDT